MNKKQSSSSDMTEESMEKGTFRESMHNNHTELQRLLKDPSQAHLCYCFDLKFAIKLLVERDKTSTVQLVKI